jgi:hypothetical protein
MNEEIPKERKDEEGAKKRTKKTREKEKKEPVAAIL